MFRHKTCIFEHFRVFGNLKGIRKIAFAACVSVFGQNNPVKTARFRHKSLFFGTGKKCAKTTQNQKNYFIHFKKLFSTKVLLIFQKITI
jgi:hypothetical protein